MWGTEYSSNKPFWRQGAAPRTLQPEAMAAGSAVSCGCQKRIPRLLSWDPLRVWKGMSTQMQMEGCQPDTDPSRTFQGDLTALCPPTELPRCSMSQGLSPLALELWIHGCSCCLPADIFGGLAALAIPYLCTNIPLPSGWCRCSPKAMGLFLDSPAP